MPQANRILITGAPGFIGSHLTRRLLKEGLEVAIIKRNGSDCRRMADILDKVACFDLDLCHSEDVFRALFHFKPDVIFHLAAHYAVEHERSQLPWIVDSNLLSTINLLDAAKNSQVKLFVNTSSCFVYKEQEHRINENSETDPVSLYGLTKLQSEQACTFYAKQYGLPAVSFRLFPPYGPADHGRRLLPIVIKCLLSGERPKLTSGKQIWDFIYIDDIVDAYLQLFSKAQSRGIHEIFNLGTGFAHSIQEIISRLAEMMNKKGELEWNALPSRKNELWHLCADMDKTRKRLDWQPKIPILDKGLSLTLEWYLSFLHNAHG